MTGGDGWYNTDGLVIPRRRRRRNSSLGCVCQWKGWAGQGRNRDGGGEGERLVVLYGRGRRGASSLERQKVRGPPPHPSSSFSSNSNTPASRTQLPHPRLPGSLAGLPMGRACGWWQAERFGGARADKLSPAGVWRDPMTFHRHPSFPSSSSVMLPPLPLVLSLLLLLHSRPSKYR